MMTRTLLIVLLLVLGSACSKQNEVVVKAGPYSVGISTDPDPLEVGEKAQFFLRIEDQKGQAIEDCSVQFRQTMPGMEMSQDKIFMTLAPAGDGRYQGQSGEFRMGGDWVMKFRMTCAGDTQEFKLERHLEWPE